MVYRMEDEAARINLNTAAEDVLINLFSEYDNAETIAEAVIFWRGDKQALSEDYYKGGKFKTVCELLLVPGVSEEILYGEDKDDNGQISAEEKGLADYLTVYGEGKVNINTASEMVLAALIGSDYPELAAKVISYRDDYNGWFSLGREQIELETGEIKQLKNLSGLDDPTDEFEPGEWDRLKQLAGTNLTVSSDIYAISAQAEVEGAKKSVSAIVKLRPAALTEYLFFYRN